MSLSNPVLPLVEELILANTTNTTSSTTSLFGEYNILVVALVAPFIVVFAVLFVISCVSFFLQRAKMKRKQFLLFTLLLVLCLSATFSNMFRISSELAYLHPIPEQAMLLNNGIKTVDRFLVSVLIYVQILILALICSVFMETTKATGFVTKPVYRASYFALFGILVALFVILLLNNIAIFTFHGLRGSPVQILDASQTNEFQKSIFIAPCIIFFLSFFAISAILNVYGFKLYHSLQKSKAKLIKIFVKQQQAFQGIAESLSPLPLQSMDSLTTDSPRKSIPNSTSNSTTNDSSQSTLSPMTMPSTPTVSVDDLKFSAEQEKIYEFKKAALRRALIIQLGLSACLFVQSIGVLFISVGVLWRYLLLFFYMFMNLGMCFFVILLLVIYSPLREVQRLVRTPSDQNLAKQTTSKTVV
ncbi:hypothetical protein C9374_008968 [Naegleria lovaniensis]|uniref:Uncharacterized protein n=1 Tax=Naegleria lovaniensis TaxID=51637 RepID=A0AA88GG17_NAELO|nr:uncharacterized protein C9374_008968 [Naegleria lovaniensis]KAG2377883.1 hypothetical protein C9374_008968 [Naegleria lovaniensis]